MSKGGVQRHQLGKHIAAPPRMMRIKRNGIGDASDASLTVFFTGKTRKV
jgi:hypothetical protein